MARVTKTTSVTRNAPMLSFRAEIPAESIDEEKRTFDIVWTTGERVLRGYWEQHWEELSLDPKHVRMGRLASGRAPLLNSHQGYDLGSVIGVVESARLEKTQGTATVRMPKAEDDPDADRLFRKVKDKIIRNVSVGYRVWRKEKVEEDADRVPVMRATDWEPYELSLVPMGADAGAGVRAEGAEGNPCEFVIDEPLEEKRMAKRDDEPQGGTPAPAAATVEVERAPEDDGKADRRTERKRAADILHMVRAMDLGDELAEELIRSDVSLDEARAKVIDLRAAKRAEEGAPVDKIDGKHRVAVGDDLTRKGAADGLRNALLHRIDARNALDDAGKMYRGLTMMESARQFLEAHGVRTVGLGKREIAGMALGLEQRGQHSTSDFPLILADVAGKSMRRAYDEAPQTFKAWARRVSLPDFKEVKRTQLGEAPQLKKVLEGGEYTRGSIGEGREKFQLATYGRVFAVTRQVLINDDMDAFSRVPGLFGRSARDLESDLVYEHFLSNPTMGDTVALFHSNHGNLGTGAIAIAAVGAGRTAMRKQKGLDKKQRINVQARNLLVPAALETTAEQFVSVNMVAAQSSNINPFAGRLQVIAEPRLDDTSVAEWYLTADPAAIDTLEYAYLEGEEGPFMESRVGFDVDGLEIKCGHDFAAKVIDWRGFYKSSGV